MLGSFKHKLPGNSAMLTGAALQIGAAGQLCSWNLLNSSHLQGPFLFSYDYYFHPRECLEVCPSNLSLIRQGTEILNHLKHSEGFLQWVVSFSRRINPQLLLCGSLCVCSESTKRHCFWKHCCLKMNLCPFLHSRAIKTFSEGSTPTDGVIGYEVTVTYNHHSVFLS